MPSRMTESQVSVTALAVDSHWSFPSHSLKPSASASPASSHSVFMYWFVFACLHSPHNLQQQQSVTNMLKGVGTEPINDTLAHMAPKLLPDKSLCLDTDFSHFSVQALELCAAAGPQLCCHHASNRCRELSRLFLDCTLSKNAGSGGFIRCQKFTCWPTAKIRTSVEVTKSPVSDTLA